MCGMYLIFGLYVGLGWPLPLVCAIAIVGVAALGILVHLLIIEPILGSAPINQLLATGGLLFFLQSFATLLFGTEFRNIGVRLPIIELGDIYISYARLLAFAMALVGAVALGSMWGPVGIIAGISVAGAAVYLMGLLMLRKKLSIRPRLPWWRPAAAYLAVVLPSTLALGGM